ncbi:hypothetical protein M413DRAFT_426701 [Hebeloma cylindrosporum]|uniref:Ubiquitin-like-conjugating enzyme ATG10 n=1 Tax=Hebeloma cylindrosporum TaxID=76867 RepID=A0A0C3CQ87_HEBCY|nr:hypothetical protein M413DRAFT_426701 [Hebeloma cylindrosporum h7]
MLSRSEFELACEAFAHRHSCWSWVPAQRPGYGYLTRSTAHFTSLSSLEEDQFLFDQPEEEDNATADAQPSRQPLSVQEYIVYSASFNVPAFYFTMHNTNGSPLSLDDILQTSIFKLERPSGSETTSFALTLPSASFPLLSQGDHPTLGTPCWYFHPCETDRAVSEFMMEVEQTEWSREMRLVRWLELWLMVVGSVLNV